MGYGVAELAGKFGLEYSGDGERVVTRVCGMSEAHPDALSFITEATQLATAAESPIPVFVALPDQPVPGKTCLFHPHPDFMIARIAALFTPDPLASLNGIHPAAVIASTAQLADGVQIAANVVIGDNVAIGPRTKIYPNVVILDRCRIGADCIVYPNCTLREDSQLGDRVILQPGVVIGGDGYGFVQQDGRHHKIPQLGRVVLEDDVEVGANSTIDRARFAETRVGRGTKIDNLVMLGHNVQVGEDCLLVAQVGVSGSTRIGNRVTLAGQVGTVGHVRIADDVIVLGKAGVTKDITEAGMYAGMPLKPARLWRRAMAKLYAGLR